MDAGRLVARYRSARTDPGLAVLEGFHALKHALRFGAEIEHAATPDRRAMAALATRLAPDLASRLADIDELPADLFAKLAPVPPATGVVAIARRPRIDIEAHLAGTRTAPVVLLEEPSDPGNVGAAVRVAAAADAAAVLTTGRLDPWQPAALRGSAGLHFALPVARVEALPAAGRPLVALAVDGQPLAGASLPDGAILAFGSERHGLSPAILARAELRLAIPMRAGVSSLNLATAVAIALYATRPRRAHPG